MYVHTMLEIMFLLCVNERFSHMALLSSETAEVAIDRLYWN